MNEPKYAVIANLRNGTRLWVARTFKTKPHADALTSERRYARRETKEDAEAFILRIHERMHFEPGCIWHARGVHFFDAVKLSRRPQPRR